MVSLYKPKTLSNYIYLSVPTKTKNLAMKFPRSKSERISEDYILSIFLKSFQVHI